MVLGTTLSIAGDFMTSSGWSMKMPLPKEERLQAVMKGAQFWGSVLGRTDFSQIFIVEPPDFFADFVAGCFLFIFVRKSVQKNPPGKSPTKSSKIYTAKISDTCLQRSRAQFWKCSGRQVSCVYKELGTLLWEHLFLGCFRTSSGWASGNSQLYRSQIHSSQKRVHTYILVFEFISWKVTFQLQETFSGIFPENYITLSRLCCDSESHGHIVWELYLGKSHFSYIKMFSELISQ